MSTATYSFLPYLRQGLANSLKNTGGARAVYTVALTVDADGGANSASPAPRDVELYGPGDIVGIDARVILKTDPLHWITNFESNYVAYIDFMDEDYPWRYSPVEPEATHRLKPWIALIVLKEDEFEDGKNIANRPLAYLSLKGVNAADLFSKWDQLWAWAHVHVNTDIVGKTVKATSGEIGDVLDTLQSGIDENPDIAYSRLMCPRKLEPNTKYHAFVVPAFESGRRAGLGDSSANISAAGTKIAWEEGAPVDFPIYYRWQFATGTVGDFEYLVRLLEPKPADLRVGRRDMDMTSPGANLQWVEAPDFSLEGILRLGGALQVPYKTLPVEERNKLDDLDGWGRDRLPHPFQSQVSALLNLADDYSYKPADEANVAAANDNNLPLDPNDDADPLITPPIYGRWHAMVERVLEDRQGQAIHYNYNWVTELNLDPRYRVPAHFGTRVVQENQEDYVNSAWEQIGDVLAANRQIRFAQLAEAVSGAWFNKYFTGMTENNPEKAFMISAPVQTRIIMSGSTIYHTVRESVLPNVVVSPALRRIMRPRGRFGKDLGAGRDDTDFRPEALLGKINSGDVEVSPEKEIAPGMESATKLTEILQPEDIPPFIFELLSRFPWLPRLLIILALVILLLLLLFGAGVLTIGVVAAIAAGLGAMIWRLNQWKKRIEAVAAILPENQSPGIVDNLPNSPDFQLVGIESNFRPTRSGESDSQDAQDFKNGLRDTFELVQATRLSIPEPAPYKKIEIDKVAGLIAERINPSVTIPAWTWENIRIPEWIFGQLNREIFTEAMAYPRFDLPMYKPLAKISADLFLPNINLIEYNSITLLETNQEFIESYMVGLNHEFARELLWREYPTDQRGSYFRQFWDVSTLLKGDDTDHAGKTEEEIREMYRDIPKLHNWSRASKLGSHDHRQKPGTPEEEEVVLVIRGELLKKYPNAVVYAHKAVWGPTSESDPTFDIDQSRVLYKASEGDSTSPSFDVIRTPLYKAEVEPDITFFGFKLTVEEAKGENEPETPTLENAGWFFVIKERPGEPRFGFDIPKEDVDAQPNLTWNDISWTEVLGSGEVIDAVNLPEQVAIAETVPSGTPLSDGFLDQREEDKDILWNTEGHQVDAADLAYILYQVPVLVAVHAKEMLPSN